MYAGARGEGARSSMSVSDAAAPCWPTGSWGGWGALEGLWMELDRLLLRLRGESTWLWKEARRTQLSARWRGVVDRATPSSSSTAGCVTAASIGYLARGTGQHGTD